MTENELILTSVLNCRRVDLYADPKPLTENENKLLSGVLRRRKNGEPLQYILGSCEFMGLKFLVNAKVLIPRPETEFLVEAVIGCYKNSGFSPAILELGTGSGNIAVSLARFLGCRVTTVDISQDALDIAGENARLHCVADKIFFIQSNLFSFLDNRPAKQPLFDIIVSNPPYIRTKDIVGLSKEVQAEPKIALDGGEDGLNFYRRIAEQSTCCLKGNGRVFMEIGDGQKGAVTEIFESTKQFTLMQTIKDYRQTERILIMERGKNG